MSESMRALITGASSGIGLELARVFAEEGHPLVLVARDEHRLQGIARDLASDYAVAVEVLRKDLSDLSAAKEIGEELSRRSLPIDVLVNNAGFGSYGALAESDAATQGAMINVNVTSLVLLTRELLLGMIVRKRGKVLNVASTAAFVPGPYMSTYYASKAFVLSHSLALSHELRRTGVTVTALCPGPTATEFQKRAGMDQSKLFRLKVMDAKTVAEVGYRGMMKGRSVVVPGVSNKVVVEAARFGPRGLLARIAGKLNRSK